MRSPQKNGRPIPSTRSAHRAGVQISHSTRAPSTRVRPPRTPALYRAALPVPARRALIAVGMDGIASGAPPNENATKPGGLFAHWCVWRLCDEGYSEAGRRKWISSR